MTSILLIAVGVVAIVTMTSVAAVAIIATRPAAETASVSPFAAVGLGCPAADTLSCHGTETILPDRRSGDWRVTTLNSLSDVETFLDHLENCRVDEREMHILSNNSFAVRWKAVA